MILSDVVSGDAGCPGGGLADNAISFNARGFDQATPTRIYFYGFRNRATFQRLASTVDACARKLRRRHNGLWEYPGLTVRAGRAGPMGTRVPGPPPPCARERRRQRRLTAAADDRVPAPAQSSSVSTAATPNPSAVSSATSRPLSSNDCGISELASIVRTAPPASASMYRPSVPGSAVTSQ